MFIFANKIAAEEIEELQLKLESKVCVLGVDGLKELGEHLQVNAKELGQLALSKRICEKIEQDLSEEDYKKNTGGRSPCICRRKTITAGR